MAFHKPLGSKDAYEKAIQSDKYVVIYVHDGGEVPAQAEEGAKKFADKVDAYHADAGANPQIKDFYGITKLPSAVLYKSGKEIKKVDGADPAGMAEIGQIVSA
ncbi:hypothetical protein K431DRAFT_295071 [Polychaeton citri CBS 116435]|uniref:Thioredoxin domain-containing protein n=1 Tax=Polychaeton citri CBS 116435 TaxID=1314669 RepID=A0A9P4Q6B0_9PEZI|nr:hypothetical protein K431DRAFT_295071 [Polychaeton citri CBS 116435]